MAAPLHRPVYYSGCYSLHLYCDHDGVDRTGVNRHGWEEFPHEFNGETFAECARQARKLGWVIHTGERTATCPKCSRKRT
jgi:hypothetical protein